jgi:hypothetical protein
METNDETVGSNESVQATFDVNGKNRWIAKNAGPYRRGDALQIILMQVKGGSAAKPTFDDAARLRAVARRHGACEVLLATWKKGRMPHFIGCADRLPANLGRKSRTSIRFFDDALGAAPTDKESVVSRYRQSSVGF